MVNVDLQQRMRIRFIANGCDEYTTCGDRMAIRGERDDRPSDSDCDPDLDVDIPRTNWIGDVTHARRLLQDAAMLTHQSTLSMSIIFCPNIDGTIGKHAGNTDSRTHWEYRVVVVVLQRCLRLPS